MTDARRINWSDMDAAEVVGGAAASDAGAWKALVEQHAVTVLSIARARGLSEADAADVAQTVWLRLLEHIGAIREPERVGGWLATTTRNECVQVWRHRAKVTVISNPELLDLIEDGSVPEPEVETQDRDVQLRAVVATLPRRHQAILGLLMSDAAPSYVQVATDLGIAVGSIGPTRQRCLRSLQVKCVAASIGAAE